MKFTGSYKKSATEPVFGQLFLPTTSIRLHLTKNGLMLFEKAKGPLENLRNLLIVRTLVILLKFERKDLIGLAVSQTQINLTNRLITNANFRCCQEISKPHLPSLSDLNPENTANNKRQFHKHCKCQK